MGLNSLTKTICSIDNEEEHGESSTMPDCGLHVDLERLVDVTIVESGKRALSTERLSCADG